MCDVLFGKSRHQLARGRMHGGGADAELGPALRAGGSLTRAKDQARIDFLAQARNRALEPLWLNSSMATSTSLLLPHDPEVSASVHAAHSASWVCERLYGALDCSATMRSLCWTLLEALQPD